VPGKALLGRVRLSTYFPEPHSYAEFEIKFKCSTSCICKLVINTCILLNQVNYWRRHKYNKCRLHMI